MNRSQALLMINAACARGHVLTATDTAFVAAARADLQSFTPDPTTRPYGPDELTAAVVEIAQECAAATGLTIADLDPPRSATCTTCGAPNIEGRRHAHGAAPLAPAEPDSEGMDGAEY